MEFVQLLLTPIIWVMSQVLGLLHTVTGVYGLAIIGLSILVRLAMTPISKIAAKAEETERAVQAAMEPDLFKAKKELKGREQFEQIEKIYEAHGYHPIKSVVSLLPIALQIPFLLSALFLLVGNPLIEGRSFLFVNDLGAPDGLLNLGAFSVNLLPLLLTCVALFESHLRRGQTQAMKVRFLIVSVVIAVLIYPLPAAVCLYWLTSNVWSFAATVLKNRKADLVSAM